MSITNLSVTDTFRIWFNKTNEIINKLNTGVVADGTVAFGVFALGVAANTSFDMVGALAVNSSSINASANLTVRANTTITSDANVFNLASSRTLLQSPLGTIINASPFTVNSNALFTAAVTISNNVTLQGTMNIAGNLVISNAEIIAGPLNIRQILFGQANAMLVPAAISSPTTNDYGPAGLDEATILNLSSSVDATITGMLAPAGIVVGGTLKYIQNIGLTNKITLTSNSAASGAFNRFKTPNDAPLDILPGGAIIVIWSSSNKQWRVAGGGPASALLNALLTGNTNNAGNLAVTGLTTFLGNSTFGALTLFVDTTNNRVGVKTASPTDPLTVNGNVSIIGTFTETGLATFNGNAVFGSNTTITGILTLNTVGNNAVFGNTIAANSVSQSFFRNLKANTFTSDGTSTLANVSSSGKATLTGTLVVPVGVNKWAT